MIRAHTHTDWVGSQTLSWADKEVVYELYVFESKTYVTREPSRALTIGTHRQRILQDQFKISLSEVSMTENNASNISVSFDDKVTYVEHYALHAFIV